MKLRQTDGGVTLTFIGPSLPCIYGMNAINDNSVSFIAQYREFRMLFTGMQELPLSGGSWMKGLICEPTCAFSAIVSQENTTEIATEATECIPASTTGYLRTMKMYWMQIVETIAIGCLDRRRRHGRRFHCVCASRRHFTVSGA
jgi:hypothetical protein